MKIQTIAVYFLLYFITVSTSTAFRFSQPDFTPWTNMSFVRSPSEAARHKLIKQGVSPAIAEAAFAGLTDEQLKQVSGFQLRILAKVLSMLEKTVHEYTGSAAQYLPTTITDNPKFVEHVTVHLAGVIRRSIDLIFDILDGQYHGSSTESAWWKSILEQSTHKILRATLCKNSAQKPLAFLCHNMNSTHVEISHMFHTNHSKTEEASADSEL